MCLAVPGKVIVITNKNTLRMGQVDFGGVTREVCLESVPGVQIGDYVIVHAGFALNILSESEANKTLDLLREMDAINKIATEDNTSDG